MIGSVTRPLWLILSRAAFVCLLVFVAGFGVVSLIGYPGPFVLTACSLGGLPAWVVVRRYRSLLAVALAALACVVPVLLLLVYTGDGDFTVPEVIIHITVLVALAYGLARAGLAAGEGVWRIKRVS